MFLWDQPKTFRIEQELRKSDGTLAAEVTSVGGLLDLDTRRLIPDPALAIDRHAPRAPRPLINYPRDQPRRAARVPARNRSAGGFRRGLVEAEAVTVGVGEDGEGATSLLAGRTGEGHAAVDHRSVVGMEVVAVNDESAQGAGGHLVEPGDERQRCLAAGRPELVGPACGSISRTH